MAPSEKLDGQRIPPASRLRVHSWVADGVCFFVLVVIGHLSSVFQDMYHGLNVSLEWRVNLVSWTRLAWTLPVGVGLAVFLVLKDRSALRPRAALIDLVAFLVTVAFGLVWAWAAFSPIFFHSWVIGGAR